MTLSARSNVNPSAGTAFALARIERNPRAGPALMGTILVRSDAAGGESIVARFRRIMA
jgi:hypothetical protein